MEKLKGDEEKKPAGLRPSFEPPEGGWGWVVCVASFWTNGTLFGIMNSFGVLLVEMLQDPDLKKYGADAFTVSWIGSLSIGLTFLLSPVASVLTDKFGCRKTAMVGAVIAFIGCISSSFAKRPEYLFITYGILLGTGASFAYTPSLVILGHYFKKRLGLVNGLVTAGSGLFTIVLPILMGVLVEEIGLWNTLRFISGIVFMLIPASATFRPILPPGLHHGSASDVEPSSRCMRCLSRYINVHIWRNKNYIIWCTAIPIGLFGYFVPFVHLINHLEMVLPNANGAVLIGCLGATSLIGRLIFGKVADIPNVSRIALQQVSFLVIGVMCTLIPLASSHYAAIIVAVLVMGIFDGCFVSLMGPIAFDIVGAENASQAIGFILGLMSVPLTLGPPIAGYIFESSGSYNIAFIVAGAPPIIGACILFLVKPASHITHMPTSEPLEYLQFSREDLLNIDYETTKQWELRHHLSPSESMDQLHRDQLPNYVKTHLHNDNEFRKDFAQKLIVKLNGHLPSDSDVANDTDRLLVFDRVTVV
ncbi:monocarboxylate transporter 10-like [Saccoglossus kowalevskii]|uniref:Monocarboxylate transporter 10-like n=1 Tax=Saccoglossus kowalevskii TaxID=10224 RepID=A0ABM0GVZ5_SACKO|nr:PREDICTED: monocarboxylate transporter 10-like [Saccoglossus kowalevskii]